MPHRGAKARNVTADAGCALGAMYTAFEDLDWLILQVNARILARLGAALRQRVLSVFAAVYGLVTLTAPFVAPRAISRKMKWRLWSWR
ncbi:MAG: hypothetical protein Q8L76_09260 [Cypionkella sp.]|nr:hypothetical protein [Cypionkella sp.]MDP1576936.1 hypothetical protein [Cypionkella sp.]MDP2049520.1 hypothetical protein [Cypionkella sp.]